MKISLLSRILLLSVLVFATQLYGDTNTTTEPTLDSTKAATQQLLAKLNHSADKDMYAFYNTSLHRICFFDTRGSAPFVRVLETDKALVKTYELSKNLSDFKVIVHMEHNLGEWTLLKESFAGKRKSYVSKAIERAMLLHNKKYECSILVDEYKAQLPFVFKLKSMSELSIIIQYLMQSGVQPNTTKNFLFMSTDDDFDITKLSDEEATFLTSYFTVEDATSDEFAGRIEERFNDIMKLCTKVNNGGGVVPLYGDQRSTVLALLDKGFYKFEGKVLFPLCVQYAVVALLFNIAVNGYSDKWKKILANFLPGLEEPSKGPQAVYVVLEPEKKK